VVNMNDMTLLIILTVCVAFRCEAGHAVVLRREKNIITINLESGGVQEFVEINIIRSKERKFVVLVVIGAPYREMNSKVATPPKTQSRR